MFKTFSKILLTLAILIIGLAIALMIFKISYSRQTEGIDTHIKEMENNYSQMVAKKTNVYTLTKIGLHQTDIGLTDMALISLHRATSLEKNYRDSWLALGLAQIQKMDYVSALTSLKIAEKLDPINPKTYELLNLVYQKMDNSELAQAAQEKYKFLTKKQL